MERAAAPVSAPAAVVFRDGLGDRRHVVDPTGHEALEVLCLRSELSSVPSFEFSLRERVSHLAQFRNTAFGRVRGVERLGAKESMLAVVSDATPGIRLSNILAKAEERRLPIDINTALCLMRQLVPAVAQLHEHGGETAHGAIGAERLVLTPNLRLVTVEYVMGAALKQLKYSRERYWSELRVALPRTAGLSRFDQRADVTQIGTVALSLILGRLLKDEEYPARVTDLVASTWAVSARGGFEPLPPGLRAWLGRALQLDLRNAFASAIEARTELDKVIGDSEFLASPASLEEFMTRYRSEAEGAMPPSVTTAPRAAAPTPVAVPAPVRAVSEAAAARPIAIEAPAAPITPSSIAPSALEGAGSSVVPRPAAAGEPAIPIRSVTDITSRLAPDPVPAEPADDEAEESREDDELMQKSKKASGDGLKWPALAATAAVAILATGGYLARGFFTKAPAVATTGSLTVTTNPAGAEIAVDGQVRGTTPITLTLSPGGHQIELRGSGEPRVVPVTITAGTEATQYIELPAARSTGGQLQVRTEPPGATVIVDGVTRGTSPLVIADLTPGEHAVVLNGSAGSSRQTVTIERGATASLVIALASSTEGALLSGYLSVSTPVDVQIFENNRLLGTSATEQIMVSAGRHDLDLVNEALGYHVSRTVQVPAGKTATINLEMPKGVLALQANPWAEVWVDGEKVGDTPIGNMSLTIGPHSVVFRHPELGEQHHTAMVSLKGTNRLSVDLRKK